MGRRDRSTLRSDSGYGENELPEPAPRLGTDHPLTLKGYDIGPASKLHVGDVFEFVWADAVEFEWEWKCLGYERFIVLRQSETTPSHCVCIPICTGGPSKHEFAKPGIDYLQQGFIFANGDPKPEQTRGGPKLQYSPVGVELRPGRLRLREDSRANYADILQIKPNAHVLVVGDVVKYFDRVRRNVNKAFMRQIIRTALEKCRADKAAGTSRPGNIMESTIDDDQGGAACDQNGMDSDQADTYTLNESPTDDERDMEPDVVVVKRAPPEKPEKPEKLERHRNSSTARYRGSSMVRSPMVSSTDVLRLGSDDQPSRREARESRQDGEYDLRSMHRVALTGVKP